jgi:hypothetical protein
MSCSDKNKDLAGVGSGEGRSDSGTTDESRTPDNQEGTPQSAPGASVITGATEEVPLIPPSVEDDKSLYDFILAEGNRLMLETLMLMMSLHEQEFFSKVGNLICEDKGVLTERDFSQVYIDNKVFEYIKHYRQVFGSTTPCPDHLLVFPQLASHLVETGAWLEDEVEEIRVRVTWLLKQSKDKYAPYLSKGLQIASKWLEAVRTKKLIQKAADNLITHAELAEDLAEVSEKFCSLHDGTMTWRSAAELKGKRIIPAPEVVEGLFRLGEVVVFSAASKSGKTWLTLYLALAVAAGWNWLNRRVYRKGAVLYCNFELDQSSFESRVQKICAHCGGFPANFHHLNFRGRPTTIKDLTPMLIAKAKECGAVMIVIDALYNVLGDCDENSNGEMAQFMAGLTKLSLKSRCSVVVVHHHSKHGSKADAGGPAANKMSGAGAIHRAPEGVITFSPATGEFPSDFIPGRVILRVDASLRTLPDPGTFYITRDKDDPLFAVLDATPPSKKSAAVERAESVALWLRDKTLGSGELKKQYRAEVKKCSDRSIDDALAKALELGLLVKTADGRYAKSPAALQQS